MRKKKWFEERNNEERKKDLTKTISKKEENGGEGKSEIKPTQYMYEARPPADPALGRGDQTGQLVAVVPAGDGVLSHGRVGPGAPLTGAGQH